VRPLPQAPFAFAVAGALLLVAATGRAFAAPLSAHLTVARAAGAEDCPDRDALARVIERILTVGPAAQLVRAGGDVRADVRFARLPIGYEATLHLAGAKAGARTLTDTAPNCTALGRAVGITLALLLDAGPEAPPPEAPPPPAPPAPVGERATAAFVGVRAGTALGLVGAPAFVGGVALELSLRRRWWLQLDASVVAARATKLDEGDVDVSLVAGRARACGAVGVTRPVQVAGCAVIAAGALRGEGRGYPADDVSVSLPWTAAGVGVQATTARGRWRLGLGADVLAPLRKSTFSIVNRGVAFRSEPVAAMLELSVGVQVW
jgi:hypothetical protein